MLRCSERFGQVTGFTIKSTGPEFALVHHSLRMLRRLLNVYRQTRRHTSLFKNIPREKQARIRSMFKHCLLQGRDVQRHFPHLLGGQQERY